MSLSISISLNGWEEVVPNDGSEPSVQYLIDVQCNETLHSYSNVLLAPGVAQNEPKTWSVRQTIVKMIIKSNHLLNNLEIYFILVKYSYHGPFVEP